MRILVTAASKHGSTEEIAGAIGAELVNRGLEVTVVQVGPVRSIEGYDPVVLGSAVYPGEWMRKTIGSRDHRPFAGRLDRKELNFLERASVRMAKLPDGDFRPWDAIGAWAAGIADALHPTTPGRSSR